MPKKADESKKQLVVRATQEQVIDTNTYNSQRKAIKKYESKIQQLTVRLPKGTKVFTDDNGKEKTYSSSDVLNKYIENSSEYNSVNEMIKKLIEDKLGYSLEEGIAKLEDSLD